MGCARPRCRLVVLVVLLGIAAAPRPLRAGGEAGQEAGADDEGVVRWTVFGQVGFGQIDEDYLFSIAPGVMLRWDRLSVAVHAPLRFVVADYTPTDTSVLRREDWDEASDFTRLLRFVEWGDRREPLHARLGELVGVTLGHGTLVDRYFNTINVDHYQTGLEFRYDGEQAGGELFLDNVVDPNLVGLRAFVRPLRFLDLDPLAQGLTIGATFASDFDAPLAVRTAWPRRLVTADRELSVTTDVTTLYGLDLGWELVTDLADVTPYLDVNFQEAAGMGVHLGLRLRFRLPSDTLLLTRLEYRFGTRRYAAGYVNSLYEIERYQFRGKKTKLAALRGPGSGNGEHGFLGELTLSVFRRLTVTVIYEDYEGDDNSSLTARLRVPWVGPMILQLYYTKRNLGKFKEIFTPEDALVVTEIRVKLIDYLYVYGAYARQWHLVGEETTDADYATVNDWSVGAGSSWTF